MGTTPNYGWPYPELTNIPDGATQMKSLANGIDTTLKAQINAPIQQWTPTFTGFTLGNGIIQYASYRKVGGLCYAWLRINAAASAPTTAFTSFMGISSPVPYTGEGAGLAWFVSASVAKLGVMQTVAAGFQLDALRQADLGFASASSIWGTGSWPIGSVLKAQIMYPI